MKIAHDHITTHKLRSATVKKHSSPVAKNIAAPPAVIAGTAASNNVTNTLPHNNATLFAPTLPTERINVTFNSRGHQLAGIIERPLNTIPLAYAVYAHCFSCGKDSIAAVRIGKHLAELGYAVLRFDFEGIGKSEGEFADSNFSSQVHNLVDAAAFLTAQYSAPKLLIGHSLGGRAAISAAVRIRSIQAVATIGAPADASHVSKQFLPYIDEIQSQGFATVKLAGRDFQIKKQFLDDIRHLNFDIEALEKPLLIFHSPADTTVQVSQANKIYQRAQHPKSFVSLDNANHLLTAKADALFVAQMTAMWASKYLK
jgi:putative redox protein